MKNITQKYNTSIQDTLFFYSTHKTRTRLYNTGNPAHYTTRIQYENKKVKERQFHTTQNSYNTKIQHNVGILGAGLEALRRSPR